MTAFAHSLAVVIGIDAYGHGIPRLTTAVNDATRLAELLQAEHGYETILLTQEATGQPITQERLRTLFNQDCAARLGPDDRLLVYFAGHGVALDGDDGPAGYLVPQDARPDDPSSLLAMTDLHTWLTDLHCRHMLAILDCCFAGAFRWAATRAPRRAARGHPQGTLRSIPPFTGLAGHHLSLLRPEGPRRPDRQRSEFSSAHARRMAASTPPSLRRSSMR